MVSEVWENGVCMLSRMKEVSQGSRDFCFQKYSTWSGIINM